MEIAWLYPGQPRQLIPGQFLCAPATEPLDLNDDNLPDAWAAQYGVSGEYNDADNDGLSNLQEYHYGTDPLVAASVPGYLNRDVWYELSGPAVVSLTQSPNFLKAPQLSELWAGAAYPSVNLADSFGQRLRGTVEAPVTGQYTFWISGDDNCELWLSSDDRKFQKKRIAYIEGASTLGHAPFGSYDLFASQKSALLSLQAGHKYYIEILHKENVSSEHVEVAWQKPGGPREIIPAQYLGSFVKDADDLDDDDLPDSWELQYGLDPTDNGLGDLRQASYADYDNDGLTNREEYLLGTDPLSADSDADGLSDYAEVYVYGTNPLVADLIPGETVANLSGTSVSATSTNWHAIDGSILGSTSRRGWVEYRFLLTTPGRHFISIHASARGAISSVDEMPLRFSVDNISLGSHMLISINGGEGTVGAATPWLLAGEHVLRIFSENTYERLSLQINSIEVKVLNGAGVNQALLQENAIAGPDNQGSEVSPVCIEGNAAFPSLVGLSASGSLAVTVYEGLKNHWYGDVALNEFTPTTITATFENGASEDARTIQWKTTNVLQHDSMVIRVGDSLRLTAFPGQAPSSSASVVLTIEGTDYSITPDQATLHQFNSAGDYTLEADHTLNGVTVHGSLAVKVLASSFGPDFPIFRSRPRSWTLTELSPETFVESDSRLYLLSQPAATGRAFQVNATQVGDFHVLARTSEFGPILARGTVTVLDVASTTTTGDTAVVYSYENGDQLVRMGVVIDRLPPGGYVRLDIFVAGVTFQDGTRSLILHAADFDENGVAYVVFNYPDGTQTSVCHHLSIYDANNVLVGTR